jgi:hypothetical protein
MLSVFIPTPNGHPLPKRPDFPGVTGQTLATFSRQGKWHPKKQTATSHEQLGDVPLRCSIEEMTVVRREDGDEVKAEDADK